MLRAMREVDTPRRGTRSSRSRRTEPDGRVTPAGGWIHPKAPPKAWQLSRAYLSSSHSPKRRFILLMHTETITVRRFARRLILFASHDGVKSVGSDLPRDGCAREALLEQR